MCSRAPEVAPPQLDVRPEHVKHVGEVGGHGAEGGRAGAVGLLPLAHRDQCLDPVGHEHRRVDSVPAEDVEPLLGQPGRLPWPSEHRQHIRERDVPLEEGQGITGLLGELESPAESPDALVRAADIGEVPTEVLERPALHCRRVDRAGERKRLLAHPERLVEAPGEHQAARKRNESTRALRRGRLDRNQPDHSLGRGESCIGLSAFVEVASERVIELCRARCVALRDEVDRSLDELDRSRRFTGSAGELGGPGAELGEVEARELGSVGHGLPEGEGSLEVGGRLRQPEDGLCLARRLHGGCERLARAARGRPVGGKLGCSRSSAAL